jgi:hypothetical protein
MLALDQRGFNPELLKIWLDAFLAAERTRRPQLHTAHQNASFKEAGSLEKTLAEVFKFVPGAHLEVTGGRYTLKNGKIADTIDHPQLVLRMPHYRLAVSAPYVGSNSAAYLGALDLWFFANESEKKPGPGVRVRLRFGAKGVHNKLRVDVTQTLDALGTQNLDALLQLQTLVDRIRTGGFQPLVHFLLELADRCYGPKDQRSADYNRLLILSGKKKP